MAATLHPSDPHAPSVQTIEPWSPAVSPQLGAQLDALISAAGVALLDDTGWMRVTGEDRVRWLNGMVTNSIPDLALGEGCYNFALNAQGRIQGDLTAFALEDSLLLESTRQQIPALMAHLNRFIIMDDVELIDASDDRKGILIAGPHAADVVGNLGLPIGQHSPLRLQSAIWRGAPVDVVHAYSPLVPRFELWSDAQTATALLAELISAGATPILSAAIEQLRILEGTPRYGIDIRNSETARDLPQETGQTRALHFTKGCYLGQEIVERIHSRGNVHRAFTGFRLSGALPAPGALLEAGGKPAGEITSVASVALAAAAPLAASQETLQIALGYVRREALAAGLTPQYPGGTATPVALPFAVF